ncbi:MAG: helix-hairpin-helix domain-containing protein [Gammaproteobacteria bacterium]|nr:helix-hairpin-helix domain-containing protein [Gammaproteobacteria bacterium]
MKSNLFVGVLSGVLSLAGFAALAEDKPASKAVQPVIVQQKLDLNTAQVYQLIHVVKGIGKKRAEAIVTYRDKHQGFHSVDELANVPGIGKRFVEAHLSEIQAAFVVVESK